MNPKKQLMDGLFFQNPVTVQLLGMCSTMAITTTLFNGLGMGVSVLIILPLSNILIAALRKIIPNNIRIACFIVVIAGFVTIVDLMLQAFIPALSKSLGLFIPLIVVNCIILGRAEAYASKNPIGASLFDGIGMGLGFTIGLTFIGVIRELIGVGTVFGFQVMPEAYEPVSIFVMAPGAFFVLALLTAVQNRVKMSWEKKGKDASRIQSGCSADCASCASGCKGMAGQGGTEA